MSIRGTENVSLCTCNGCKVCISHHMKAKPELWCGQWGLVFDLCDRFKIRCLLEHIPAVPTQKTNCLRWGKLYFVEGCGILLRCKVPASESRHIQPLYGDAHVAVISEVQLSWHHISEKHSECVCVSECVCACVSGLFWFWGFLLSCQCHFLCNKPSECLMGPAGTVTRVWSASEYPHVVP